MMQSNQPLSNEQLLAKAPSIFAGQSFNKMSDRYAFVPTSVIVDGMRNAGFFPVFAQQSISRTQDRKPFARHMIRFQASSVALTKVGTEVAQVVLINSHDGSSLYDLSFGLWRLACLNGLMVASAALAEAIKIRHTGNILDRVIEGSTNLLKAIPRIEAAVNRFKTITLSQDEQMVYATAAHQLRYTEESNLAEAIKPEKLLKAVRLEDSSNDLFTVFNRVQEHLIRGNVRGVGTVQTQNGPEQRRVRTREIKGITQSTNLNRALWTLTEGMADLHEGKKLAIA